VRMKTTCGKKKARRAALSGKAILVILFALGLAMAGFGWFWRYNEQRRPLAYWGSEHAVRMNRAEQVLGILLEPGTTAEAAREDRALLDRLALDPARWQVAAKKAAGQTPGLSYLRQALLMDQAYLWEEPPLGSPVWRYALAFEDGTGRTTFLAALDPPCLARVNAEPVRLTRTGGKLLEEVLLEIFPEDFSRNP